MLRHTRRRALGLLIAAAFGARLISAVPRAFAQDEDEVEDEDIEEEPETEEIECFDSKKFGPWTAQASDGNAGAILSEAPLLNADACDLTMEVQVNTEFESKVYVAGSQEGTPLPEEFLVKPENRLIAKTADGTVVVDVPLCGNCTDIYDDAVSIVLPLATAPLLRDEDKVELAIRLAGKDADCRFDIDAVTMRQALDWAATRRDELAKDLDDDKCASPGCFITTACCEVLGLDDDCFELRTLRRYRDTVLARQPGGQQAITRYYALAPHILARIRVKKREARLLSVYARFVLPAAIAARLGLNALAYRLYVRMLADLTGEPLETTRL
jgi:hypothetical protein